MGYRMKYTRLNAYLLSASMIKWYIEEDLFVSFTNQCAKKYPESKFDGDFVLLFCN